MAWDEKTITVSAILFGLVLLLFTESEASAAEAASQIPGGESYAPPPADIGSGILTPQLGSYPLAIEPNKIELLAEAIANAEGFYRAGTVPQRGNNPGDLTTSFGFPVLGKLNSEGVLAFASVDDGWSALKSQVAAMLAGTSRIYNPGMTILQIAELYTGGDAAASWAQNVANYLGLSPQNTLMEYLAR